LLIVGALAEKLQSLGNKVIISGRKPLRVNLGPTERAFVNWLAKLPRRFLN
jgi:short-subunit dehydrogenase involved in D-alanine esterification of teichoic acids